MKILPSSILFSPDALKHYFNWTKRGEVDQSWRCEDLCLRGYIFPPLFETLSRSPVEYCSVTVLPAPVWLRQKFHTTWSVGSHYTAQFNWLRSLPLCDCSRRHVHKEGKPWFGIVSLMDSPVSFLCSNDANLTKRRWWTGDKALISG